MWKAWKVGTSIFEERGNGGQPTYQKCWFASFDGQDSMGMLSDSMLIWPSVITRGIGI